MKNSSKHRSIPVAIYISLIFFSLLQSGCTSKAVDTSFIPLGDTIIYLYENGKEPYNRLNLKENSRFVSIGINNSPDAFTIIRRPFITLHYPKNRTNYNSSTKEDPFVLWLPSGGFSQVDYRLASAYISYLTQKGVTVGQLVYRLANVGMVELEYAPFIPTFDAENALLLMYKNANKLGIDATNINVLGTSAGGNIAAHLQSANRVVTKEQVGLKSIILLCPLIDLSLPKKEGICQNLLFKKDTVKNYAKKFSATSYAEPDSNIRIIHSERYASYLNKHAIKHTFLRYNAGGHGLFYNTTTGDSSKTAWLDSVVLFVTRKN
jgi:acetyl esterase/lipase